MPQAIENYTPLNAGEKRRRQATLVWGLFGLGTAFWISSIVFAPIAEANGWLNVSSPIYKFFSYICHQIPERSYFLVEQQFAVCTRCFGIYAGLFGAFILYPFFRSLEETEPLPYFWLFLAMIPMAVDWSLGFFEVWENTDFSRFLTGLILGAACAAYTVPALIEIFRLLARRGQVKRLSS